MASKKSKIEETPEAKEDRSRLAEFMAGEVVEALKKKMGSTAIMRAADLRHQNVPRISSGIFALDYALGGGFQAGRVHTLYGQKSSAKSAVVTKTIGQAQRTCANCYTQPPITDDGEVLKCACGELKDSVCAYIDVEGTFDTSWARKLGVDPDRLLYSTPDYAEESLDICEALIRSGDVDVLVLDSLAFLTPLSEIENSIAKESVGVQARLLGKGVRKLNAAITAVKNEHGRLPTIFFINQIRMKVGVMFGSPETVSGGQAPGYMATTEIKTKPGKYEMDEVTGKPIQATFGFRVEKNKSSPLSHMEGEFKLVLSDTEVRKIGSIDEEGFMVNLAEKFGIVTGRGSSYQCFDQEYRGKSPIEKALLDSPAMKAKLRGLLIQALLAA